MADSPVMNDGKTVRSDAGRRITPDKTLLDQDQDHE